MLTLQINTFRRPCFNCRATPTICVAPFVRLRTTRNTSCGCRRCFRCSPNVSEGTQGPLKTDGQDVHRCGTYNNCQVTCIALVRFGSSFYLQARLQGRSQPFWDPAGTANQAFESAQPLPRMIYLRHENYHAASYCSSEGYHVRVLLFGFVIEGMCSTLRSRFLCKT